MHKKLGKELKKARTEAGFSQEYMAEKLFVGRRTIINWENGKSSPDIFQTIDWYKITNRNPIAKLYTYLYPEIKEIDNDETELDNLLKKMVTDLPLDVKKMVLFLLQGNKSFSPYALINMAVAHTHCQMFSRVNHAITIYNDYKMYEMSNKLDYKDEVLPDMEMLGESIKYGIDMTMKGEMK